MGSAVRISVIAYALGVALAACANGSGNVLDSDDSSVRGRSNTCGNGQCSSRESCETCPIDCGLCQPDPPPEPGPDAEPPPPSDVCVTATSTWYNESFATQAGSFEATFEARPSTSPMDGVIALSSGPSTTYAGFAVLIRFNPLGNIDARNDSMYEAVDTIPYQAGANYLFRLTVNTSARTYSAAVRAEGASQELALASGFAFRTEQSSVTSLGNWGTIAGAGSQTVCNTAVQTLGDDPIPVPTDTEAPTTPTGVSAVAPASHQVDVTWAASSDDIGVVGYEVYRDGALAGATSLTSFSDTGRTPDQTYCYEVLALDAAGNSSSRSSPPACATTPADSPPPTGDDCDYVINAGESVNKYSSTATPGQTVCIRAGTYSETLTPQIAGTAGNLIVFRASPGDECKGDVSTIGMQSKTDCRVRITGGVSVNPAYVRIEGFELTGSGVDACGIRDEIVNNFIHNIVGSGEWGIQTKCSLGNIADDRFTVIENNEIADTGFKGLSAAGEGVVVRGNYVHRTFGDPSKVQGVNILFEYNRLGNAFTAGHSDGIEVYHVDGLVIRNNMVWDTSQNIYITAYDGPISNVEILGNVVWCDAYCADGSDAPGVTLDNVDGHSLRNARVEGNTFYSVTQRTLGVVENVVIRNNIFDGGPRQFGSGFESGVRSYNLYFRDRHAPSGELGAIVGRDPLFLNPAQFDFRLQSGSPAIDTGNPAGVAGLVTDYVGTPRPLDGPDADLVVRFDIGAYEFRP